jgi:hypothetical protein
MDSVEDDGGTAAHGTEVCAWFDTANVDTPPEGDLPGLFRTVLLFSGPSEMMIRRVRDAKGRELNYEVRKTELVEALGDLDDTQSLILLDRYLRSLESDDDDDGGEGNEENGE